MATRALGRCPDCGASIPRLCLLIEYETASDRMSAFAECPECGGVVHPQTNTSEAPVDRIT